MSADLVALAVAGIICLAVAAAWLTLRATGDRQVAITRLPPEPVEDAAEMLARWHDEAVDAALEKILGEGGGRG